MKHAGFALWVAGVIGVLAATWAIAGELRDWRSVITARDVARLESQDQTRTAVMTAAREKASAPDFKVVQRVMASPGRSIARAQLLGNWRCRSIQMGAAPYVMAYGFFNCQIEEAVDGLVIHKTSGSQRIYGRLYPETDRSMVYLGAQYLPIDGRPPGAYGDDAQKDQAGRLYQINRTTLRLEIPAQWGSETYEVLQLVRVAPR